jgi:hypothetical protein
MCRKVIGGSIASAVTLIGHFDRSLWTFTLIGEFASSTGLVNLARQLGSSIYPRGSAAQTPKRVEA